MALPAPGGKLSRASQTQLVSGLAGAIECSFRSAQNQLVFTEYGGKLSRLNLFAPAVIVSQGSAVLKGTFTFDLDNGAQGGVGPELRHLVGADDRGGTPDGAAEQRPDREPRRGQLQFGHCRRSADSDLRHDADSGGNNNATNKLVTNDVFSRSGPTRATTPK